LVHREIEMIPMNTSISLLTKSTLMEKFHPLSEISDRLPSLPEGLQGLSFFDGWIGTRLIKPTSRPVDS
jgi:hypothetical protein